MSFKDRLKEARIKRGLKQKELAEIIGVTPPAITNYENGTSHPKEDIMYKLFDALDVSPNFLFQDSFNFSVEIQPKDEDWNSPLTVQEQQTIYRYLQTSSKGKIDDYINMIYTLEGHEDTNEDKTYSIEIKEIEKKRP